MKRRGATIIRMIRPAAVALPAAILLAACGGDSDSPSGSTGGGQASLVYSYPLSEQAEVPTPAPVVLHFSQSMTDSDVEASVSLRQNGQEVPATKELVENGRSLILTPNDKLDFHSDYTVSISGSSVIDDRSIPFSTRAAEEGSQSQVLSNTDELVLSRVIPDDSTEQPMMDFSTLRLQFSQPLDRDTVRYGDGDEDTVALMDENDEPVPAWVVVDGPYLTIDPKEDLIAGEQYILNFANNEVKSITGDTFAYQETSTFRFNPDSSLAQGTEPDERPLPLVQRITTPEDLQNDNDPSNDDGLSPLTGQSINEIPVNAVLLGDQTTTFMARTQQEGDVLGDLAYLPDWPSVSPLRIRRGTLLTGSEIDVKIGGEVDAGFDSGTVNVHFLSDANGYLMPNIYDPDGPRMVRLFLDVAMSTTDPTANGAVTQNIAHLELIGTATTDTNEGVIDINAVGVVEPMILGQERGYGTLSFQLQTYRDQTEQLVEDVRQQQNDTTPPQLQSWMADQTSPEMPADESGDELSWFQQPGDPIVLNFDEPLEAESLNQPGALTMTRDGAPVEITHKLDGAALVIQPADPEQALQFSEAGNNPEYQIQLGNQITDLAGNNFIPETLTFKLPGEVTTREVPERDRGSEAGFEYVEEDVQVNSPMLLSAYPGYPCVTEPEGTLNLDSGLVGRCAGGPGDWPNEEYPLVAYQPDDLLPLMSLPANRPIVLQFTKAIDPASVELGGSFDIFRVDASGQPIDENGNLVADPEPIPGSLNVEGQRITFVPDEPWEADAYYQYTLGSNNNTDPAGDDGQIPLIGSEEAVCDGTESICGKDGHPLRTQPLGRTTRTAITPQDNLGSLRIVADYLIQNDYFIPEGGGPDMAIFFEGEPDSGDVLQTLRSSPDVDTNANLIHDADAANGKVPDMIGFATPYYLTNPRMSATLPDGTAPTAIYPVQEEPVPSVPDPNADPVFDPEGIQGLPNSAKILSLNSKGTDLPWYAEDADLGASGEIDVLYSQLYSIDGANVGCSFDDRYDPVTGAPGYDPESEDQQTLIDYLANDQFPKSEPAVCPENKFTYLKMGLNASVGRYDTEEEAIKVEIYPSQSISTSFITYPRNAVMGAPTLAVPSGEQIMRMRYAKDDPSCVDTQGSPCSRTQPITAWIKEVDGVPTLTAEVDLYIDAPFLGAILNIDLVSLRHNLRSYPATMSLSGPVSFLDDGRMVVQQRNGNPIDIDVKMYYGSEAPFLPIQGTAAGRIRYQIPQNGVFLQMVSEPIKSVK